MKQWKQVLLTTIHSEDFEKDWDFLLTLQKEQALVHVSPIIMNVACLLLQHSEIFGQLAS